MRKDPSVSLVQSGILHKMYTQNDLRGKNRNKTELIQVTKILNMIIQEGNQISLFNLVCKLILKLIGLL